MSIQEMTGKEMCAEGKNSSWQDAAQKSNNNADKNIKKALLECEKLHNSLVDIVDVGVFYLNKDGRYSYVSERWSQITRLSQEESIGSDWWQVIHADDQAKVVEKWKKAVGNNKRFDLECRLQRPDGSIAFVCIHGKPQRRSNGGISFVGALEDKTNSHQKEAEFDERNEFIDTVLENLPVGVAVHDIETGSITYMNDMFSKIYGWKREDLQSLEDYFEHVFPDPMFRQDIKSKMTVDARNGGNKRTKWENLATITETGEKRVLTAQNIPLTKQNLVISTVQDQTEYKRVEDLIIHLAAHDPHTDLPNRTLFLDRINYSLAHARRNHQQMAVLLIDLDNFKAINDVYGRPVGDSVLLMVTERLKGCLRESDTIARMGGDEFGVLIEGITSVKDISPVAKKILTVISHPYRLNEDEIYVTSSIGISVYPIHGDSQQSMLQSAELALQGVKADGKNGFRFFTEELAEKTIDRMVLGKQLHRALENDEFVLHYQPQVDARTRKILGIEALLRWDHPEFGIILPGRFLSIAEETGMIIPIGEWVLRTACEQNIAWQKAGLPPMRIGVNLSARQLRQRHLVELVKGILDETGLDPDLLELELTENIVFQNTRETVKLLQELKDLGIHLAIDDFGAGYTSLSYLTRFPFDTLKIDLCFAKKIITYPSDAAIVAGVIAIANSLHMATVIEGVETIEQLQFFQERGCHQVQGWIFSPAVPAEELQNRYCELIYALS